MGGGLGNRVEPVATPGVAAEQAASGEPRRPGRRRGPRAPPARTGSRRVDSGRARVGRRGRAGSRRTGHSSGTGQRARRHRAVHWPVADSLCHVARNSSNVIGAPRARTEPDRRRARARRPARGRWPASRRRTRLRIDGPAGRAARRRRPHAGGRGAGAASERYRHRPAANPSTPRPQGGERRAIADAPEHGRGGGQLRRQLVAALQAPGLEDGSAGPGRHAVAEPVPLGPLADVRLDRCASRCPCSGPSGASGRWTTPARRAVAGPGATHRLYRRGGTG